MSTINVALTDAWQLIATGPVAYMSIDGSRKQKYSSIQFAFSSSMPSAELEGHPLPELRGIELDAGESLYARANGPSGQLIISGVAPARLARSQNG